MSSKSEAGDALHGDGFFFTDMKPADHTMSQVAYNNYQNPFSKLAYCVTVTMPRSLVKECHVKKRRIFLHGGNVGLTKTFRYIYKIEKSQFKKSKVSP